MQYASLSTRSGASFAGVPSTTNRPFSEPHSAAEQTPPSATARITIANRIVFVLFLVIGASRCRVGRVGETHHVQDVRCGWWVSRTRPPLRFTAYVFLSAELSDYSAAVPRAAGREPAGRVAPVHS